MIPGAFKELVGQPWALEPGALAAMSAAVQSGQVSAWSGPRRADPGYGDNRTIAVIPVWGLLMNRGGWLLDMLGGTTYTDIAAGARQAAADPSVVTIVLLVDSPGGGTYGTSECWSVLREVGKQKRLISVVSGGMAASAAYWLATAGELVASPSSDVGSIGCFWAHSDVSKAEEMAGIRTSLVAAGKYKTELFDGPLSTEARAYMQKTVDAEHETFLSAVAAGRRVTVADVRAGFGQGRLVPAREALGRRMIDRIGTLEEVLKTSYGTGTGARAYARVPVHDGRAELERRRGHLETLNLKYPPDEARAYAEQERHRRWTELHRPPSAE